MIEFISEHLFFKVKKSGMRELTRSFKFRFSHKKQNYSCEAPKGMETDLASVPKVFWSLFPKDDPEYLKSAICHDYFYKVGGQAKVKNENSGKSEYLKLSRLKADQLFVEGAKNLGASWIKRKILFVSVRMGGGSSWGKKKPIPNMKMNPHKNPDPRIRG